MGLNPYSDAYSPSRELYKTNSSRSRDPLKNTNKLVTNAGIAREAYFQSFNGKPNQNFWSAMQTRYSGNAPFAVDEASQLWSTSLASKGMISTWKRTREQSTDDFVASKLTPGDYLRTKVRHGFAFHYNPTTVDMNYGLMGDIDPTTYTSGLEAFNDLSAGLGTSTIQLNLVVNRLHDMQYFNKVTGRIDPKYAATSFSGRRPDTREQKDIWTKGTMYDIEFLLRTIVGFEVNSLLGRNASWDNKTADIGFLTGMPVELHLGKSLRYLGRIENLSIKHILFTERMVPTFSQVNMTFTRIPDFAGNSDFYTVQGDIDKAKTNSNRKMPTEFEVSPDNFSGVRVSGIPTDYPENETYQEEYDRLFKEFNN